MADRDEWRHLAVGGREREAVGHGEGVAARGARDDGADIAAHVERPIGARARVVTVDDSGEDVHPEQLLRPRVPQRSFTELRVRVDDELGPHGSTYTVTTSV